MLKLWGTIWILLLLLFMLPQKVIEWCRGIRYWLAKHVHQLVSEKEWNKIKDDFEDI